MLPNQNEMDNRSVALANVIKVATETLAAKDVATMDWNIRKISNEAFRVNEEEPSKLVVNVEKATTSKIGYVVHYKKEAQDGDEGKSQDEGKPQDDKAMAAAIGGVGEAAVMNGEPPMKRDDKQLLCASRSSVKIVQAMEHHENTGRGIGLGRAVAGGNSGAASDGRVQYFWCGHLSYEDIFKIIAAIFLTVALYSYIILKMSYTF